MDDIRVVLDTNSWVSYAFFRSEETAVVRSVQMAIAGEIVVLASRETLDELYDVFTRPGWNRYVSIAKRIAFFRQVSNLVEMVDVTSVVDDCPDPKDNKFLALALDGKANFIVTGDQDLLRLCHDQYGLFVQPWRNVRIFNPAEFVAEAG